MIWILRPLIGMLTVWTVGIWMVMEEAARAQLHRDVNDATTTTPDINLFDGSTVNVNDLLRFANQLDERPVDPEKREDALNDAITYFKARQDTLKIGPSIVNSSDSSSNAGTTDVEADPKVKDPASAVPTLENSGEIESVANPQIEDSSAVTPEDTTEAPSQDVTEDSTEPKTEDPPVVEPEDITETTVEKDPEAKIETTPEVETEQPLDVRTEAEAEAEVAAETEEETDESTVKSKE